MDIEGVVIFEANSGIPLYSRMKGKTDPSLFSGFVSAIGHFSKELRFGGLSSFTTEEKVIYLAPREKTITALIAPKKKEYQVAYSLANELGRRFEENLEIPRVPQPMEYDSFASVADEFLTRMRNPFVSEVSSFVNGQYEGEVLVKARLFKRDGSQGVVDLLVDTSATKEREASSTDLFGANYIFVKVSESVIGRVQMIDFMDSLDGYGVRVMDRKGLGFRPYFPSRAVVVARSFDEGALQFVERFPKHNDTRYIDGTHIYAGLKMKDVPKESRCYVDLWRWREDSAPELLEV